MIDANSKIETPRKRDGSVWFLFPLNSPRRDALEALCIMLADSAEWHLEYTHGCSTYFRRIADGRRVRISDHKQTWLAGQQSDIYIDWENVDDAADLLAA